MPDVVSDDELNALAAEYVLGTLDYEERKGAAALLEVDHAFRGIVRIWERRFGDLHLMVEAVEPDSQLWLRIQPKIAGLEQLALAIPSTKEPDAPPAAEPIAEPLAASAEGAGAEPPPAPGTIEPADAATPPPSSEAPSDAASAAPSPDLQLAELAALLPVSAQEATRAPTTEPQPEPAPEAPGQPRAPEEIARGFVPPPPMVTRSTAPAAVGIRRSGRGWMAAAMAMALVAVVLAGLIGAWRYFPERLPDPLRLHTVLNLPLPPPPPPPPPPRPQLPPFDE
ncbi:MAG: hypothetical protein IT536_07970 [Hyphomicrobiales bacterium]|nr:hypothetical protein [Hyphomicrobiales bacterium]